MPAYLSYIIQISYVEMSLTCRFNTSMPRQDGRHFLDDISNESNLSISIKIKLKFAPKGPNIQANNIPALVQIMTWRRPRRQAFVWTNAG